MIIVAVIAVLVVALIGVSIYGIFKWATWWGENE